MPEYNRNIYYTTKKIVRWVPNFARMIPKIPAVYSNFLPAISAGKYPQLTSDIYPGLSIDSGSNFIQGAFFGV